MKPHQCELFPIEHSSLQRRRLLKRTGPLHANEVNPERIYLAEWKRENKRSPGVNRGYSLIEWILCPDGRTEPLPVSTRDARVAASVIQWLGTNCGLAFMRRCEQKIRQARSLSEAARRRRWLLDMEAQADARAEEARLRRRGSTIERGITLRDDVTLFI